MDPASPLDEGQGDDRKDTPKMVILQHPSGSKVRPDTQRFALPQAPTASAAGEGSPCQFNFRLPFPSP